MPQVVTVPLCMTIIIITGSCCGTVRPCMRFFRLIFFPLISALIKFFGCTLELVSCINVSFSLCLPFTHTHTKKQTFQLALSLFSALASPCFLPMSRVFVLLASAALFSLSSGKQVGPGLTDYPFQGESITRLDGLWDLSSENGHSLKANVSRNRAQEKWRSVWKGERKQKKHLSCSFAIVISFPPSLPLSPLLSDFGLYL